MLVLSLFSTSTHALDGESKGRDLYASCVSCHGETGNKVWLRSREIASLSKEEFVALSVGYQEQTYGKESKIVMQNRLDEHTLEDIIKVAEYLGLK